MPFIDSKSSWDKLVLMCWKGAVFEEFKVYVAKIDKQYGVTVKCLRSDNGQEYFSNEFKAYCKEKGIKQEPTVTEVYHQVGVSERCNRTYMELTRALLISANLAPLFWGEAIMFVNYLCNRMATKRLDRMTPYEVLHGKKPDLSGICVFGCKAWSLDRDPKGKLASKFVCCVYMGLSVDTPGNHRLYNPNTQKFISSRDVIFDESLYYYTSTPTEGVFDFELEDSEEVDEEVAVDETVTDTTIDIQQPVVTTFKSRPPLQDINPMHSSNTKGDTMHATTPLATTGGGGNFTGQAKAPGTKKPSQAPSIESLQSTDQLLAS
jgi:hypothetical protein